MKAAPIFDFLLKFIRNDNFIHIFQKVLWSSSFFNVDFIMSYSITSLLSLYRSSYELLSCAVQYVLTPFSFHKFSIDGR